MMMKPHRNPHHAILNLEGGEEEVLHLQAFGKDLGIEIRVDDTKAGVVIITEDGYYQQPIPGQIRAWKETVAKYALVEEQEETK